MTPQQAYLQAKKFGGTNGLRNISCNDSEYAFEYALHIDKQSHDETRSAACLTPSYAYLYALYVDKQPHDETRIAACKDPKYAYLYAFYVDKQLHQQTMQAVIDGNDPDYCYKYFISLNKGWFPQEAMQIFEQNPEYFAMPFQLEIEP